MRPEVIDYWNNLHLDIPNLIDRGKGYRWRVKKRQVEAACEFVYLQIHEEGLDPFDGHIKLPAYILNRARKIRMGHYYKVNLGDPVLLDDLTAIRTLEHNLLVANTALLTTLDKLFLWKAIAVTIFVGLSFVIFKTNWYY